MRWYFEGGRNCESSPCFIHFRSRLGLISKAAHWSRRANFFWAVRAAGVRSILVTQ